jgi:hypothetical protein
MKLHETLSACPPSWGGFIRSLEKEDSPEEDTGGYTTAFIDKHLEPYHANYIDTNWIPFSNSCVIFETEADAIVFKLKYGSIG